MIDYALLAIQNPWWQDREAIGEDADIREFLTSKFKYIPENILELKLENGAINIVCGPRQTGKTTALKLLIKSLLEKGIATERIFYFNCDALESRKDIIDLALAFFEGIKEARGRMPANYMFLDEISSISDWPYAIKWLVDSGLLSNSKIILTGSSSISLKKSGEFLPGRRKNGKDIKFLPISFNEYLKLVFPQLSWTKRASLFEELKRFEKEAINKGINLKRAYKNFLLSGGFLKIINLLAKKEPLASTAVELYKSTLKSGD